MPVAHFLFHPDLNDFLAPERRGGSFEEAFENGQSIKHLFEAAGVPHTEVGQMLVNGQRVDLDYQVADQDQVEVFSASPQNAPLSIPPRFVLDGHLGRLAAYLRMLGFDVLYRNNYDDEELADISAVEDRILLTRDRRLLMRKAVRYGYCLRSLDSLKQVGEVIRRFDLLNLTLPFRRCLRCNTPLEVVTKEMVLDQLQPLTRKYYEEFRRCPTCGQIYWKGSHYEHMTQLVEQIRREQNHTEPGTPA